MKSTPTRAELYVGGRRLSFLEFGGTGAPLLALHGHMSEGASFADLAGRLRPEWRVVALDQRGHGDSDRAPDYRRDGYVADVIALLDHLGLDQVVLLGHSLGGINAYHVAAQYPERVRALVDVDGPVEVSLDGSNPLAFVAELPYTAPTRVGLLELLGPAAHTFADDLRRNPDGTWRLPFLPADIVASEDLVRGSHWAQWCAGSCPTLLVRGTKGTIPPAEARKMTDCRPGTTTAELNTGHFVHTEDPVGFARVVRRFLQTLPPLGG